MTEPTTEAGRAAALVEALTFLSTYEKDPPEVMKDDYAYDRLLAFVHDVAARALAAPAPTVSVSESPTHSWPCPDPDHTYPATPPTPALTAARERERKLEEALQLMQQERDFYLTSATHLSSRHGGPMTSCYDEVCRYWSEVFLQVVAARG